MKYVYLDWNVIKYMIEHRGDQYQTIDSLFLSLVINLKKSGMYSFPYSEAHIRDRANKYKPEYYKKIKGDLSFISRLSNSMCLGTTDDCTIQTAKKSVFEFFAEIVCENQNFEESGLRTSFFDIFYNAKLYKNIRDQIPNLDNNKVISQVMMGNGDPKLVLHCSPFVNSLSYDLPTLRKKWKGICESWLSFHTNETPSLEQMIVQGYSLLDYHPLFNEKLKPNKNTLDNIIRDGRHAYYASCADFFVTEDDNTKKKTSFIYEAFDIKTRVVSEKEFLETFANKDNNTSPIYL